MSSGYLPVYITAAQFTSLSAVPAHNLVLQVSQTDEELLKEEGCGTFTRESCGAIRYSFATACKNMQPIRTAVTRNPEIRPC